MNLINAFIDFMHVYGKELAGMFVTIVIAWLRDNAVEARNKQRIAELETKLLQNKIDVDKENAGLTSSDVVRKYIKPSEGTDH